MLRPDVFDDADDFDHLRPKQLVYVQKMKLAADVNIREVFEDGNITKLKEFPELEKAVQKAMDIAPNIAVLKKWLWTYMVTPPEDSLDHPDLSENFIQYLPEMTSIWDSALKKFRTEVCLMPLVEIYRKLDDIPKYASHRTQYHTPALSLQSIRKWFQFQFGGKQLNQIIESNNE